MSFICDFWFFGWVIAGQSLWRAWDRGYDGQAALYDEKFVSGIKRWADCIEENGAVSNLQLMNCGRVAVSDTETSPGPSDVPTFLHVLNPPQELSKEDIHETIQQHKKAAELGVEASQRQGMKLKNGWTIEKI
ncbi:hypothetical protein AKJ61_03070 [candidate division MSBL1 archaeon SCGC-AAA259B11]|uniref:NADH:flavin oxidoreductase/NADH oxidase N-terminal domain-containing protein n=1 Tax=candidate division MSBL1 archaeon SCGC-AAA259B11 TaxID=1698260 RepID=A0A133U5E4_9EURY|nr:hypothetical protein AKJ61_03070 [candidate division MSBL1 archaeon SCGC-AAA259B11]